MAVFLSAVTESAAEDKFIYKCISLGNTSAQLNVCKNITENTAKTREWLDQNWPSTRLQDWVSDQTFDWRLSVRDQQIDRVLCRWYTDGWLRIQTAVSLSSRHCCSFYTSKPELWLCFHYAGSANKTRWFGEYFHACWGSKKKWFQTFFLSCL